MTAVDWDHGSWDRQCHCATVSSDGQGHGSGLKGVADHRVGKLTVSSRGCISPRIDARPALLFRMRRRQRRGFSAWILGSGFCALLVWLLAARLRVSDLGHGELRGTNCDRSGFPHNGAGLENSPKVGNSDGGRRGLGSLGAWCCGAGLTGLGAWGLGAWGCVACFPLSLGCVSSFILAKIATQPGESTFKSTFPWRQTRTTPVQGQRRLQPDRVAWGRRLEVILAIWEHIQVCVFADSACSYLTASGVSLSQSTPLSPHSPSLALAWPRRESHDAISRLSLVSSSPSSHRCSPFRVSSQQRDVSSDNMSSEPLVFWLTGQSRQTLSSKQGSPLRLDLP